MSMDLWKAVSFPHVPAKRICKLAREVKLCMNMCEKSAVFARQRDI